MRPSIRDGDVVSVARIDPARVAIGDVICYAPAPGRLTLHRVVGRDAAHVLAKGDALAWSERVPVDGILGVVTAIERRGRLGRIVMGLVQRGRRVARLFATHA